ncbi:MAG: hypothetical protein ABI876_15560, partial [Bacteroidota bacterium]
DRAGVAHPLPGGVAGGMGLAIRSCHITPDLLHKIERTPGVTQENSNRTVISEPAATEGRADRSLIVVADSSFAALDLLSAVRSAGTLCYTT